MCVPVTDHALPPSLSQRDARAAELSTLLSGHLASGAGEDIAKYVKLVQLGQPVDHVKARMKADGVNPDLLKL